MKLTNFRVQNFRAVNDSGVINTSKITSLIGRNESGKTNLLLALQSLNPPDGMKDLSPIKDFPRDRRISDCVDDTPVVETTWLLDLTEREELRKRFSRASTVSSIKIGRHYKGPPWVLLAPKQRAQRSALATILVLTALVFGWVPTARADDRDGGVIRIMTQNLFQGTNFSEILSATTPPAFLTAVTTTRQNILATKPAERAAAVAREIARERPDLVALQEAAILRSGFVPLTVPATPVPTVDVDQLALVLAELEQLGHRYHVVAILPNLDAQAPSSTGASVRLTARMAIIARSDLGSDDIRLSNIQEQGYLSLTSVTTPVGVSISDPRGWASVDVRVNGRELRFITTHLDQNQSINRAQAAEALQSAVNSTTMPVVFVGDFNVVANIPSDPRFANYQALLNAGLVDAWQQSRGPDPGLNCCQPPALTDVTTNFTFRVDLVLLRGAIDVRNIHLVGNNISDRVDGVWPSDHAGIVATLRIPKDHN